MIKSGQLFHSKEGMIQGDLLVVIAYVIGVIPLIQYLQGAHPYVIQQWPADDAVAGVGFGNIITHFKFHQVQGPPQGYFPELTKIIVVISPWNVARAEEFFWGMEIMVSTRNCYIGGFIGDQGVETMWLNEKVQGWAELMRKLLELARKNPQ